MSQNNEVNQISEMHEVNETKEVIQSLDADIKDDITLKSKEGDSFIIPRAYAVISNLIKVSFEKDQTETELGLSSVDSKILRYVVEYMQHHQGKEGEIPSKPLRSKVMKEVCTDQWDADFIDKIGDHEDDKLIFKLTLAANYMDIKCLLHLACAKVASKIKGKPIEEIKKILGTSKKVDDGTGGTEGTEGKENAKTVEETKEQM
jgi:S-phase kinase-associated protein 1